MHSSRNVLAYFLSSFIVLFAVFSINPASLKAAPPEGTYKYELTGSIQDGTGQCDVASVHSEDDNGKTLAIKLTNGSELRWYCHVEGSRYQFSGSDPHWITVNSSTPELGEYGNEGSGEGGTITISNSVLFKTFTTSSRDTSTIDGTESNAQAAQAAEENGESCESLSGAWGWIMCPVILLMDSGLNFLDTQIARLLDVDSNRFSPEIESAWGIVRNISYFILIPIMLVMVIGTALGFEVASAYTIKKALPRMLLAVIFMALSWQLCLFLISLFNVLGAGTLGLLTNPFGDSVATLSFADLFGGANNIFAGLGQFGANVALAAGAILLIAFFWPTALMVMAIAFLVLLVGQILIVTLVLAAPLAILAWIFPGNDKPWKLWWSSFSKLLIMYPLIMAVLAVGRIFAYTIAESSASGLEGAVINPIFKIVAYVAPYGFIPLTFKFAGGIFGTLTGAVNDRSKGFFDKQRQRRSQKFDRQIARPFMNKRADVASNLANRGSKGSWVRRRGLQAIARGVSGQNLEADMSAKRALVAKEINDQIATGKDDEVRGLMAAHSFDYAKSVGWAKALEASAKAKERGDFANDLVKESPDGTRQYKTLGGAWVSEANVTAGRKRWGNDAFAQQAALSYEMRKAMLEGDVNGLSSNFENVASALHMSDNVKKGAWIGAAFENQNQQLLYKYTDTEKSKTAGKTVLNTNKDTRVYGQGLVDEIHEKRGSYPVSQMGADTIRQLTDAYGKIDENTTEGAATKRKIEEIASTFVSQIPGSIQSVGSDGQPVSSVSAPGAAQVNNAVGELARITGVKKLPS